MILLATNYGEDEYDFPTPEPIVRAGQRALAQGRTRYTPALGLPELRRAIGGYYEDRFGVSPDAGRVAVTPGASGALLLVLGVLVNPGDEVIIPSPYWVSFPDQVSLAGGTPVFASGSFENGFRPTLAAIEAQETNLR